LKGLYLGRQGGSIVGRKGGLVDRGMSIPQALQSQPESSNYQFRRTFPLMFRQVM